MQKKVFLVHICRPANSQAVVSWYQSGLSMPTPHDPHVRHPMTYLWMALIFSFLRWASRSFSTAGAEVCIFVRIAISTVSTGRQVGFVESRVRNLSL